MRIRRASVGTVVGALLASALLAAAASPASAYVPDPGLPDESNGGTTVMPMGDSITDGYTVPGGYRIKLWDDLTSDGYTVDFVGGSTPNGYGTSLGDHNHQGQPGNDIASIAYRGLMSVEKYQPRTVLLLASSNDLGSTDEFAAAAPGKLAKLIDDIHARDPNADIFVSTLLPQPNPTYEARIEAFNAQVPGIVAARGDKVHLVNMYDALTVNDLSDGVHPTRAGYDKMADVWYTALKSVPGALGQPVGKPVGLRVDGTNLCLDVAGASTTPLTQTIVWSCHGRANQQWTRTAAGELRVYGSDCLDVYGGLTAAGSRVVIYPCHGGTNQLWSYQDYGILYNGRSGRCAALENGSTGQGTRIVLADCDASSSAQRWVLN
jgi:lysophospholipase L1-like esterase